VLEKFAQQIANVVQSQQANHAQAAPTGPSNFGGGYFNGKRLCHFCNSELHILPQCPHAEQAIKEGKCIRNVEGRLVLPGGGYIPRNILGKSMMERFDEWHRQNPGQKARGILSSSTIEGLMYTCMPGPSVSSVGTEYVGTLRMSAEEDEIERLERQINVLRKKQIFDGVEIPYSRSTKPRAPVIPRAAVVEEEIPSIGGGAEKPKGPITRAIPGPSKEVEVVQNNRDKEKGADRPVVTNTEPPVHPYANIPEAHYAPPATKNFGAPADKSSKDREPAYRTVAPIAEKQLVEDVYNRALKDTKIVLTVEELLNISPEFRERFRKESTPRRVSIKEMEKAKDASMRVYMAREAPFTEESRIEEVFEEREVSEEEFREVSKEEFREASRELAGEGWMEVKGGTPRVETGSSNQEIEGYIVPDQYEIYLRTLAPGEDRRILTVAKESHALRAINMLVDRRMEVECIVDPGCQIIAMSEEICHELGLSYDPTIQLNMQSANGEIDRSLGLSRNVPCRIGTITLFLQMHVIRESAYDILLGSVRATLRSTLNSAMLARENQS